MTHSNSRNRSLLKGPVQTLHKVDHSVTTFLAFKMVLNGGESFSHWPERTVPANNPLLTGTVQNGQTASGQILPKQMSL